jgi:tannase
MRSQELFFLGLAATANAASLASVCTTSYAVAALPLDALEGVKIDASSVTATATYNASVTGNVFYPDSTFDYCNVTVRLQHLYTALLMTDVDSLHTPTMREMIGFW